MSRVLRDRRVLMLLRLVVGGIFIYASWEKIFHPDAFATIIMGYRLVPRTAAAFIAVWLPWTELFAGVALVVGFWARAVGLLLSFLTAVFLVGLVQALARGLDIRCGCFSLSPEAATRDWLSLWQEALLLGACLWLWVAHWPQSVAPKPGTRGAACCDGADAAS